MGASVRKIRTRTDRPGIRKILRTKYGSGTSSTDKKCTGPKSVRKNGRLRTRPEKYGRGRMHPKKYGQLRTISESYGQTWTAVRHAGDAHGSRGTLIGRQETLSVVCTASKIVMDDRDPRSVLYVDVSVREGGGKSRRFSPPWCPVAGEQPHR